MTALNRLTGMLLSLLLLPACATETMNYTGAAVFPPAKARAAIRETILNQPSGYAPDGPGQ